MKNFKSGFAQVLLPVIIFGLVVGGVITMAYLSSKTNPRVNTKAAGETTVFGNAAQFYLSSSSSLVASPTISLSTNPFTIEFWFKNNRLATPPHSNFQTPIASYGNKWAINMTHYYSLVDPTAVPFALFEVKVLTNSLSEVLAYPLTQVPVDSWHHLAISSYSQGNTCSVAVYLDGRHVDTDVTVNPGCQTMAGTNTDKLTIGTSNDMLIEEFRISNNSRYTNYNLVPQIVPFISDTNTLILYHFDASTGAKTVTDASSNHFDGQINGKVDFAPSQPKLADEGTNITPYITTMSLPGARVRKAYSGTVSGFDPNSSDTLTMSVGGMAKNLVSSCVAFAPPQTGQATCTISGSPDGKTVGVWRVASTITDDHGATFTKILPLIVSK